MNVRDSMRVFDYQNLSGKCLGFAEIKAISTLHEYKGRQELFLEAPSYDLSKLVDIAKIQSTGASNRIEGIFTSDKRLKELVSQKAEPRDITESEIAGYREVLSLIHENYEYIPLQPGVILQLHRDLYSYLGSNVGGIYKNSDNVITEIDATGNQKIRFIPVPAFQTSEAMDKLCFEFSKAWDANIIDKLILIPMFVLDFLCIHPFNDGNGRMSRLLSLLLFYKAGYLVGKYISFEITIEKSKESYYEALHASSIGWHEGQNDYKPFISYYLGALLRSYSEFEDRIKLLRAHGKSKSNYIKDVIDQKIGKITKKEIINLCPHISKITIERTLANLVKNGYLEKIGGGPTTAYVKK